MRDGARTPEELETMLEDAYLLHDREALPQLFADGAVLAPGIEGSEARGMEGVARTIRARWARGDTYVANVDRVLQSRGTALVLGARSVSVMRRGQDRRWRYAISLLSPEPTEKEVVAMTTTNKRIVRRKFEELIRGNLAGLDEVIGEEIVAYDAAFPEPTRGRDAYRAGLEGGLKAFADLKVRIDDQIAEGDRVVTRYTSAGRHEGGLFGMPPTHRSFEIGGVDIHRIEDGRVVEEWSSWDALGLLRQLRVLPEIDGLS
jgi:steroid delta-isomerase-like uncharacterized protein